MFEPAGSLVVECELTAETNGVETVVFGSGSHLTWDLVDVGAVLRGQPLQSRHDIAALAEQLRSLGLTLDVTEGRRILIELGNTSSWSGRWIFGSSAVRPRSLWRLLLLAWRRR